ncbi:MAG: GIY-YIG nuclease family protein [Patescibacteria group bacterium]
MKIKLLCVYIMMNEWNTTLYVGVSSQLKQRVYKHKNKLIEGFTKRYNLTKLVYYECVEDAYSAISREKQIKKWRREKKIALIKKKNPEFKDLYNKL